MNNLRKIVIFLFVSFNLFSNISYAQDTSSARELGSALGTLLGKFLKGSGEPSSQQSYSPPSGVSDMPSEDTMARYKKKNEEIGEYVKTICNREDLKVYWDKTACKSSDLTILHLVDESKVTTTQKKILPLIDYEYKKFADMQIENYRDNIKPDTLSTQLTEAGRRAWLQNQKNLQELYLGKITWGQYNTVRRDSSLSLREEVLRLSKLAGY
jgi:hypothetical protein